MSMTEVIAVWQEKFKESNGRIEFANGEKVRTLVSDFEAVHLEPEHKYGKGETDEL